MDLSKIEIPDTAEIHVKHPTQGPLYNGEDPVTITVYGPGSDQAAQVRRMLLKETSDKALKAGKKKIMFSGEEIDERLVRRLTIQTAAVKGMTLGGAEITPDNIGNLVYRNPKFSWISEQVLEKIEDWEAFLS